MRNSRLSRNKLSVEPLPGKHHSIASCGKPDSRSDTIPHYSNIIDLESEGRTFTSPITIGSDNKKSIDSFSELNTPEMNKRVRKRVAKK